jgi:hypothetical protein
VAGVCGAFGYADGDGTQARFHNPVGIAVNRGWGVLFVTDSDNNVIRYIRPDIHNTDDHGGLIPDNFISKTLVESNDDGPWHTQMTAYKFTADGYDIEAVAKPRPC